MIAAIAGGERATLVAIADDAGNIVARSDGAAVSFLGSRVDAEHRQASIRQTIERARFAAGLPAGFSFASLVAGLMWYEADLVTAPDFTVDAMRVAVVPYAEMAHIGALNGGPGIAVVADDRACAIGRAAGGLTFVRAGGWGPPFECDGGAVSIGSQAILWAMNAVDRGEPSRLADAALRFFELTTLHAIAHRYADGTLTPELLADFAPTVLGLAARVDDVADAMDREAWFLRNVIANALVESAFRVTARLPGSIDAAYTYIGSVFADDGLRTTFGNLLGVRRMGERERLAAVARDESPPFRFAANMQRIDPGLLPVAPAGEPLDGAVSIAQRLLHLPADGRRMTSHDILPLFP